MTSDDVKAAMLTHALYRLHAKAAITEYGGHGMDGIADVFMLTDADFTHEFEVKVAAGDLAGELAAIEYIKAKQLTLGETPPEKPRSLSKLPKHNNYLGYGHEMYANMVLRPNYFSFVVPVELEKRALIAIEGTPYGLYAVTSREYRESYWFDVECKRRAKRIHNDKATSQIHANILRKACTEVQLLRSSSVKRCTGCRKILPKRCDDCEKTIRDRRQYRKDHDACWAYMESLPESERKGAFGRCMEERKAQRVVS